MTAASNSERLTWLERVREDWLAMADLIRARAPDAAHTLEQVSGDVLDILEGRPPLLVCIMPPKAAGPVSEASDPRRERRSR